MRSPRLEVVIAPATRPVVRVRGIISCAYWHSTDRYDARIGRHRSQVRPRSQECQHRETCDAQTPLLLEAVRLPRCTLVERTDLVHHSLYAHLEPWQQNHVCNDVLCVDQQEMRDGGADHPAAIEVEPHTSPGYLHNLVHAVDP